MPQTANFLMGTSIIGAKANDLMKTFKPQQISLPSWGNSRINKSPLSITRDQRAAIVQNSPPSLNRQEAIASSSVGRGMSRQQAPRQPQRKLAPNEFLDANGVVRQKMSVGNWKSQQNAQIGQYGGFRSNFQHFANFGIVDVEINKEYQRHQRILDSNPSPQERAFAERLLQHNLQMIKNNPKSRFLSVEESEKPYN